MTNLNETAERINGLLNDFEEPVRAMMPQLTRTVKLADEMSKRLSTPIDQVVPGLTRLADTLNSPVLRSMPTDLGRFLDTINDLSRRLSPLSQLAEPGGRAVRSCASPGLSPPADVRHRRPTPAASPAPSRPQPPEGTGQDGASHTTPARKKTTAKKKAAPRAKKRRRRPATRWTGQRAHERRRHDDAGKLGAADVDHHRRAFGDAGRHEGEGDAVTEHGRKVAARHHADVLARRRGRGTRREAAAALGGDADECR